jgi:hypothetical protein
MRKKYPLQINKTGLLLVDCPITDTPYALTGTRKGESF